MNIVLTGFMGTGKTSVGRLLAKALGFDFVDMDAVIEDRAGRSISEIFAAEGEDHFRKLERGLVGELCARPRLVIATGGGIVLDPRNVEDFVENCFVVCLNADPATILERVAREGHRPLLECGDKEGRIRSIMSRRADMYARVPHQIDTDGLSVEQVAADILLEYNRCRIG